MIGDAMVRFRALMDQYSLDNFQSTNSKAAFRFRDVVGSDGCSSCAVIATDSCSKVKKGEFHGVRNGVVVNLTLSMVSSLLR